MSTGIDHITAWLSSVNVLEFGFFFFFFNLLEFGVHLISRLGVCFMYWAYCR